MRRTVPVSESYENKLLILHHKTPELCQNPLLHPISIRKYTHTHTDTHTLIHAQITKERGAGP